MLVLTAVDIPGSKAIPGLSGFSGIDHFTFPAFCITGE